jgi:hypothetical protein
MFFRQYYRFSKKQQTKTMNAKDITIQESLRNPKNETGDLISRRQKTSADNQTRKSRLNPSDNSP